MHLKDSFRNVLNQKVTKRKITITGKEATVKKLSAELFQLKKSEEKKVQQVYTLVWLHQAAIITEKFLPYNGLIILTDTLLPSFKDSTRDYQIEGKVLARRVQLNTIAFYDTVSFRVAEKRTGLFKKETVVQTIHSNPYYVYLGTQSIHLTKRTNAWNRWIKPTLFFGAGVFLKSKL